MVRFSGVQVPLANKWALLSVMLLAAIAFSSLLAPTARAGHAGNVVCEPVTGVCYEYVSTALDWEDARDAAATATHLIDGVPVNGHLLTLNCADEAAWVQGSLPEAMNSEGAWIGLFQPTGSIEPSGGWEWVTGEAFGGVGDYSNWAHSEPNNSENTGTVTPYPDEDVAQILGGGGDSAFQWNDAHNSFAMGYIIEYNVDGECLEMLDGDNDGVPDQFDACKDTQPSSGSGGSGEEGEGLGEEPEAPEVDEHGCVQDPDGDGVIGDADECPDEAGSADNDGCPTMADALPGNSQAGPNKGLSRGFSWPTHLLAKNWQPAPCNGPARWLRRCQ
jgi:hypothetical protein